MSLDSISSESDLRSFLKPFAPYSIVDRGFEYASFGQVIECQRMGNQITGNVEIDDESFSPEMSVRGQQVVDVNCSCCDKEELQEQWCPHLIALAFKAFDEGYLSTEVVSTEEPAVKFNHQSPGEIAHTLDEARHLGYHCLSPEYYPKIHIELKFDASSLGIKVYYDNVQMTSEIYESGTKRSSRELDNILIQVLEEEGEWDPTEDCWYINTSHSIGVALGLIEEYKAITTTWDGNSINFAHDLIDACLTAEWHESSLELIMHWQLPDNTEVVKDSDIIGTTPFWTKIDNTIYKLSPSAAEIIKIFPYSSTVTLTHQQSGPILELLEKNLMPPDLLKIINPDKQPATEIKQPTVNIEIEPVNDNFFDRDAHIPEVRLKANVSFEYPVPAEDENLVYITDREFEEDCKDQLNSLGFEYKENQAYYVISGDNALDLIKSHSELLPKEWLVSGVDELKDHLKFSNLTLNMEIKDYKSDEDELPDNIDWFDCNITLNQNRASVPLSKIFQGSNTDLDRWIQLDNGSWAQVPGGGLKRLKTTLGLVSSNYRHAQNINTKVSTAQAVALQYQNSDNVNIKSNKRINEISKKLESFEEIKNVNPSALFKGKLRKYQQEGLSWLNFLDDFGFDGILADEMGLGKTVQTLALIQGLKSSRSKDKKINKPVLVVAPTSVTTNWLYETRRFTPKLKALLLQGPSRKKLFAEIDDSDLVITSYALLRVDRLELEKHEYSYVILDEAQNIKNPLTATAKAAKALKSRRRLALTGTPTENRPLELWSIFDFLMPGYLGSLDFFKNQIEKPILESGTSAEATKLLNSKTRPFILRRIKSDVEKQLPPKIESEMHVPMSESQKELYAQILNEVRPQVMEAVERKGVRGASVSILAALLRLRQVCNHPNSIEGLKDLPGYESGKFDLLKELLRESIDSGRKILLFSQFREMLSIIRNWITEEKISHLYLDGSTRNRQDLVDKFNMDPSVKMFLISLKAGGTGLNLTAADTVIIYDPWWNPAVENQAIDRAHRIGQDKKVNVYRLVTEDSIEQKIMDLKTKKSNIIDALINDNGLSGLSLTKADLDSLFEPI